MALIDIAVVSIARWIYTAVIRVIRFIIANLNLLLKSVMWSVCEVSGVLETVETWESY